MLRSGLRFLSDAITLMCSGFKFYLSALAAAVAIAKRSKALRCQRSRVQFPPAAPVLFLLFRRLGALRFGAIEDLRLGYGCVMGRTGRTDRPAGCIMPALRAGKKNYMGTELK